MNDKIIRKSLIVPTANFAEPIFFDIPYYEWRDRFPKKINLQDIDLDKTFGGMYVLVNTSPHPLLSVVGMSSLHADALKTLVAFLEKERPEILKNHPNLRDIFGERVNPMIIAGGYLTYTFYKDKEKRFLCFGSCSTTYDADSDHPLLERTFADLRSSLPRGTTLLKVLSNYSQTGHFKSSEVIQDFLRAQITLKMEIK